MIVKNGEILAIDHIAHDNTLSGNGTSAKPVGLSETYKSSVANQIKNVNDRITSVNSDVNARIDNTNSDIADFKSSAHNEIARVDRRIDVVNAAKVDNTTFETYQTEVANSFTAVNKRITDVDAAKQDKGEYVSASDFNTFKSSAHGEIARVDGKIDTTSANLENNYYKRSQTYSQSEVDEIVSKLGAYVYVEDVNPDGSPNVDEPSSKVIYLTQIPGEAQCLQWIWLETQEWKCIGDTTVDLSDYAKTVDVVASANANKQAIEAWADGKFETKQDFESIISGYYTKDKADELLNTKVDNTTFEAYQDSVDREFDNTSAWANNTFATKTDLTTASGELVDKIEAVEETLSANINAVDRKVGDLKTELETEYYDADTIDEILASSGDYYNKDEVDSLLNNYVKTEELETLSAKIDDKLDTKLDISATDNWDITKYTEGDNIKIVGHEISGKDWTDEIADAVENKVDESELENYYTSAQIDDKFVTKSAFNDLEEEVGLIDNDLDTLSGKTVTVIKDSETVKAIRSIEPDGTISYTLSAHDGKQVDYLWKPTVNAAGDISWELALTGDTPATANIKGSDGDDGKTPVLSANGTHIEWKYTDESIWNDLGDFRGAPGADGKDGIDGTSAFVRINNSTNYWEISDDNATWSSTNISATGPKGDTGNDGISPTVVTGDAVTSELHKNGGITITITDKTGPQTFTAWNGNDGTMAGAPDITGFDGITARNTGTIYEIGLSSDYKAAIQSVSSKLDKSDFATYSATTAPNAFQAKGNYLSANALNGYATETWVDNQHYLTSIPSEYITETELANYNYATTSLVQEASAYAYDAATADANSKYVATADLLTAASNKLTGIKVGNTEYTIQETNWTTTIQTASAKAYNDATANADELYVTKTSAHNEFVNTSSWANTAFQPKGNYVATADLLINASNQLTGIKINNSTNYPIPLFGGVTTDNSTITGDGNTNPLGVAWSALSGYTITSALSAGSASYAAALGTTASYSALSDIADAINAKTDKPADMTSNTPYCFSAGQWADMTQTYYSKTEATGTFLQKNLTNTLSGDGTSSNKLGVNWSNLSGNTITSALSAGSATSAYSAYSASYATTAASAYIDSNTTSAMSDIVDELHGKLDSTAAASTYQTKDDMSAYVAVTGDQMTGPLELVGSNYDDYYMKATRTGINGHARFGMGGTGGAVIKADDGTNNAQMVLKANATSGIEILLQHNSNQTIGNVIPMVVETAGWVPTGNDYKLHIVLDS